MVDHGKLKESVDRFIRNGSLRLFFSNVETCVLQQLPSKFPPQMPSNLKHIYYLILSELLEYNPPKHSDRNNNLNENLRTALRNLQQDDNIIIKKADKGSNVVIQNCVDHVSECLKQLKDPRFYMKLDSDLTKMFKKKVDDLVSDLYANAEIDEKTFLYLQDGGLHMPIFYTLPRIHKKFDKIPPGRPIVSSINSPTEKISQFIDIILQPYAQAGESFILDTSDFIRKVDGLEIAHDEWLFAMDVTSLYTNIPHHEGIKIVSEVINSRIVNPSNQSIVKMLSLVLKCNCFRFGEDFYLQTNGTAMGT